MGLLDWFKETKDNKEDLLKRLSGAIAKAKKGNSIEGKLLQVIEDLSIEEIQEILIPYYNSLPADDRGYIRKWLIEGGFAEKAKTIFKGKDSELKVNLLESIKIMRINPGTAILVELLSDNDEGVRWLVSDIIKELQPRDGITFLIEKLKTPLKYPPARIGEILVQYGDKAIEALFKVIEQEQEGVGKAMAILGLMPLGKVYSCINKALSSDVQELQIAALEALEEKEFKEYEELPITVVTSINEATRSLINSENTLIRSKSVNILGRLPIDNGEILYKATFDENKVVRINALKGLKGKKETFQFFLKEIANNKNHPLFDRV